MKRFVTVLLLVALTVSFTAPLAVPSVAYADTGAATEAGLPPLPWSQIWQLVRSWGPMFIYLVDAILTAAGVGGSPNPPPPPPPPAGSRAPALDDVAAAWGHGCVTAAGWA